MRALPVDFFDAPYEFYEQLRAEGPVHEVNMHNGIHGWLVVDYEAAREALRHPDIRKDPHTRIGSTARREIPASNGIAAPSLSRLTHHLLNVDPPQHSRLRKLVTPAFAPARMEALAPRVLAIAEELLDRIDPAAGPMDLLAQYAFPLPIIVICEMLGIPPEDRDRFRDWSAVVVDVTMADPEELRRAAEELTEYFERLVARRRAEGLGEDLISALIAVSDEGDRLTDDELLSMVFLIMLAGHETTVNLIGNTVHTLLGDPARYRALHGNPDAVAPLIEEMLRYDGPVNIATLRYTAAPVTIAGVDIPAGELILVAIGSANHDEHRFSDAVRFDPGRPQTAHLAFGHGIHFCLGAGLARLEARIAITQLVERFPELRLAVDDTELRWRESILIRGLHTLPVEVAAAPVPS